MGLLLLFLQPTQSATQTASSSVNLSRIVYRWPGSVTEIATAQTVQMRKDVVSHHGNQPFVFIIISNF